MDELLKGHMMEKEEDQKQQPFALRYALVVFASALRMRG